MILLTNILCIKMLKKKIMKKMKLTLWLLMAFAVLSSCSSDDDEPSSNIQINPPAWIQGTWLAENNATGFKFTSNDIIILNTGIQQSHRESLEQFGNAGETVSANDESTSNNYSAELNYPAGQTVTYSFNKLSDNDISWVTISNIVLVKQ